MNIEFIIGMILLIPIYVLSKFLINFLYKLHEEIKEKNEMAIRGSRLNKKSEKKGGFL